MTGLRESGKKIKKERKNQGRKTELRQKVLKSLLRS